MMVAAVVLLRQAALRVDRAAEFAAPDDQRLVEQPALLEVLDQAVAGLIDVAALVGQPAGDVGVRVPVVVVDLHEAHAALDHPPGQQRRVGERARLLRLVAVQLDTSTAGSLREVGQLRHARLHAEGQLVLLDARVRLRDRRPAGSSSRSAPSGRRASCGGPRPARPADC